MTYVSRINDLIRKNVECHENVFLYGQNISTGSCLSGLTRNLPQNSKCTVMNTTNSECLLTGVGFGLMLEGLNGIFCMKQQDFLLLGMDHLVHTWNAIRLQKHCGSFTILMIVSDGGFEGPQSWLNHLSDISAISKIPGFTISNLEDAETIMNKELIKQGVRLIAVSQSLFRKELEPLLEGGHEVQETSYIRRYGDGENLTIVSLNFAYHQASLLASSLNERDMKCSLFHCPAVMNEDWAPIIDHVEKTGKLVICDDSKGGSKISYQLAWLIKSKFPNCQVEICSREYSDFWSAPNHDLFEIDQERIFSFLSE